MSDHSEERATMIAAGDLQEFVPRGREHCRRHPGAHNLQPRELQPASELCSSDGAAGLVGSLREVTIHERQRVGLGRSGAVDGGEGICEAGEDLWWGDLWWRWGICGRGGLWWDTVRRNASWEPVCHFLSPLTTSLVASLYEILCFSVFCCLFVCFLLFN